MNTPVINFHSHVGRSGKDAMDDTVDSYLRAMDDAGIDKSCINCIFYGDAKRCNDIAAEFVDKNPDRFIGVAFVTPHYPKEAISELERCFDQLDMKFLKIFPDYFGKPVDDPGYFPIFEWINDRGLAVMSHATFDFDPPGTTIPKRFNDLSKRFPQIKWVLAHEGSNMREGSMEVARTNPNVYIETCASGNSLGAIKFAVDRAGADRVLFGTDSPLHDARYELGKVITANISDEDKQKILGLNAIKLLGLDD